MARLAVIAVALAAAAAAGCGEGDDSSAAGTSAVSFGTVTDIGSIFVNGIQYSTIGARVTRDDAIVNESQLRRGMVVEVQGTINSATSGTAATVAIQ
ncbi:MAG TPA: hypothetical protein VF262_00630, partial [Burkholderiales bacterium]